MDTQTFHSCLWSFRHHLRMMLVDRVYSIKNLISNSGVVIEELEAAIWIEWLQIPHETINTVNLRNRCFRQAYDAWIRYYRQVKNRLPHDKWRATIPIPEQTNDSITSFEEENLWEYLRKFLKPSEQDLFIHINDYGYSYKELSTLMNVQIPALRKRYSRILQKLRKAYITEQLSNAIR